MKNFIANKFFINKISNRLIKLNSFNFGKIVQLKLGDLGEGTKEATIRTWFKKQGDLIEEVKFTIKNKLL
jgi:hypothetical protein